MNYLSIYEKGKIMGGIMYGKACEKPLPFTLTIIIRLLFSQCKKQKQMFLFQNKHFLFWSKTNLKELLKFYLWYDQSKLNLLKLSVVISYKLPRDK